MTDETANIDKWAHHLLDAERRCEAVAPITSSGAEISIDDAYQIQAALIARKVAAGETVIGAKLGLTSAAKQRTMGVHEPLYAVLTDANLLPAEGALPMDRLIHPRVEPEFVFVMGEDLAGPGVSAQDVLAATAAVCCGLEVIDSRYADFKFTLPDVVADNASTARFVLGSTLIRPTFDLSLVGCVLERNGDVVATAAGAAVMGSPAEAVALLANFLGRRGQRIQAGWVILSGGLTDAVAIGAGDHVSATFGRLGRVGVHAAA